MYRNLRTLDVGKVERVSLDRSRSEVDKRVVELKRTHEELQAVTAGGSRTIHRDQSVCCLKIAPRRAFFTTELHPQCNDQV